MIEAINDDTFTVKNGCAPNPDTYTRQPGTDNFTLSQKGGQGFCIEGGGQSAQIVNENEIMSPPMKFTKMTPTHTGPRQPTAQFVQPAMYGAPQPQVIYQQPAIQPAPVYVHGGGRRGKFSKR